MPFPEAFLNQLSVHAVTSDNRDIDASGQFDILHFGNPGSELQALQTAAVICPLSQWIRIRVTGKDRAKFLHNFCTSNIKELPCGRVSETFFTDVKARILAHGFILALPDSSSLNSSANLPEASHDSSDPAARQPIAESAVHEIWMLPGDEDALLRHLNRYVITENVTFTSTTQETSVFGVMGPQTVTVLNRAGLTTDELRDGQCVINGEVVAMLTAWNNAPIAFVCVPQRDAHDVWQRLMNCGVQPSGTTVFHHQRVMERFPLVGVDVTAENMAPEAGRVSQAICYTKGCYLGQEPIARLDAMGHVNRLLFRALATTSDREHGAEPAGAVNVTSCSKATPEPFPVLALLSVKVTAGQQPVLGRLASGEFLRLTDFVASSTS